MRTNNTADPAPQPSLIANNCSSNIPLMISLICIGCDVSYLSSIGCAFFGWSTWSSCSVSCGQGSRTRNRSCLNLNTNALCTECVGSSAQTQICEQEPCEGKDKEYIEKGHSKLSSSLPTGSICSCFRMFENMWQWYTSIQSNLLQYCWSKHIRTTSVFKYCFMWCYFSAEQNM